MAATKIIVVSGADSAYFGYLKDLVRSIHAQPDGEGVSIGVLDLGLTPEEIGWLTKAGAKCLDPGWDYKFSDTSTQFFKAMTARPHLPKHFPGYDVYLWLDADAWVQDWAAIELYLEGARRHGFAITPEVDRSYLPFNKQGLYTELQFRNYSQSFDAETARKLSPFPVINCGVFAAKASAPHWDLWSSTLGETFQRSVHFFSEQTALNYILYMKELTVAYLPSWCNWLCHRATPLCTNDGRRLVEPALPYRTLGIVHVTANTKGAMFDLATIGGGTVRRSLHFEAGTAS
ncbi:MAG: hypothetical protein EXQ86_02025 [Rhodospirillales bacterium]|nr:hypothetical protein [Rhodospirillales bacterium]